MRRVIFDIDGTLLRSNAVDDACFVEAIRAELGIVVVDHDWGHYPCSTDLGLLEEICRRERGRTATPDEAERVKARFVALLDERIGSDPASCVPMPGARELIARMRGACAGRFGLASGAWPESAATKLRHAGLDVAGVPGTFSHGGAAAGAEGRTSVPREGIIRATFQKLGGGEMDAGGVIYVGDGVWDWRASRALGIDFLGVAAGEKRRRLMAEGVAPERIVDGFGDLDRTLRLLGVP